jgi:hypothetical protein
LTPVRGVVTLRTKVIPGLFVSWVREADWENEYVSPKGPEAWTGKLATEMSKIAMEVRKAIFCVVWKKDAP